MPVRALVTFSLVTLSLLSVWCLAFAHFFGPLQEHRAQHLLYTRLREELATGVGPADGPISRGAPMAMLNAPEIGLHNLMIVEGTGASVLETGPGHRRDTALPGQAGVSVLAGRSSLFGAPFARITQLRAGDVVTVETQEGTFHYRVDGVRHAGDSLAPAPKDGGSRLTMVTSEEPAGRGAFMRRAVYVDATLKEQPAAASPAIAASLARSEAAMRGEDGALVPLTIWLELLVAALAALAWALPRWGPKQSTLVGLPVVLCLVWMTTATAARLLPNLL